MFIILLFHIVSSMYPVFYKEGQPYIILSSNLAAQVRLDELLSQFISRESDCPSYQMEQCYEKYIDYTGEEAKLKLQKEEFEIYDIEKQEQDRETIIYQDQSIDPKDHLASHNFVALGPYQSHINTLYQSGFSFCLSSTDGYLQSSFNQNTELDQYQLSLEGVVNELQKSQYATYSLQISEMQFFDTLVEISDEQILIIQDNWISFPPSIMHEFIDNFKAREFSFNSEDNAYERPYDPEREENFTPILFYNQANIDNPLIVDPKDYIDYNFQGEGYDLLRIVSESEEGIIVLGLPFLKNKVFNVQTEQNFFYIQQLQDGQCIPEGSSLGAGAIIFIICQIILLPLLVYCTFKKLRQNHERKQQLGLQQQTLVTELQHQRV